MKTEDERLSLERTILSALIMDYDAYIDLLDIPPTDFRKPNWDILRLMLEYKTGDPIVLASKSKDISIDELRELSTEIIACNESMFEEYVDALKEFITREKLLRNLNTLVARLKDGAETSSIYMEINNMKLEWVKPDNVWDVLVELMEEVNGERKVKIIPTCYTELDKLIGWFEEWQIVVIWARPGIWKSMFAINLANNNIHKWEKVALFSLEMNKKQVIRRLLAMNSWVSVWRLKEKVEWEAWERVKSWFERLENQLNNLWIYDNVHTIGDVERTIRYLVHKEWVGIVYLDYLQLIRNPSIKNNPVEAITDMSQRLKQLALELGITIVELSQMNRDADNSVIKKASQLRWSGSIEQDADMVWLLDKEDEQWTKLKVSVQKCRDWRIGEVELKQIADVMLITDLTKPF